MQDEMAGVAGKPLKVKGGKMKVKKMQLPEVMPSTHGERVVPQITTEMKAEAEKRTRKKIKVKKEHFECLIFLYILSNTVLKKCKFSLGELDLMKQLFRERDRILGRGKH